MAYSCYELTPTPRDDEICDMKREAISNSKFQNQFELLEYYILNRETVPIYILLNFKMCKIQESLVREGFIELISSYHIDRERHYYTGRSGYMKEADPKDLRL